MEDSGAEDRLPWVREAHQTHSTACLNSLCRVLRDEVWVGRANLIQEALKSGMVVAGASPKGSGYVNSREGNRWVGMMAETSVSW